jgi:A/G-specific adenine glycosylase
MITDQEFTEIVWEYYHKNSRSMPWRDNPSPYNVLVSEIMLQQTQVQRVLPKFAAFVERFPNFKTLADAPLAEVLTFWNGLGYNRRAKFLWQTAQKAMQDFNGILPQTSEQLTTLPGIGANTAGAILAYAYEQPVVFIETNIRTVIIHHFFADSANKVTDTQIKEVVERILPTEHVREWYWAIMDYGTHIKATVGTHLGRVHGHKKQSTFAGSLRQVRGAVIRALVDTPQNYQQLQASITDERLVKVLHLLQAEGLIAKRGDIWHLTGHQP